MTIEESAQLVRIMRFYYSNTELTEVEWSGYEYILKPWEVKVGFVALERVVKRHHVPPQRHQLTAELGRVCLEMCSDVGGHRQVLKQNQPILDHGRTVFAELPRAYRGG
jgi:hypothetical protein